jgi:hypothetical protein
MFWVISDTIIGSATFGFKVALAPLRVTPASPHEITPFVNARYRLSDGEIAGRDVQLVLVDVVQ